MKLLNKHDKDIYDTVMSVVKFEKVPIGDIKIPKGWMDDILRMKND